MVQFYINIFTLNKSCIKLYQCVEKINKFKVTYKSRIKNVFLLFCTIENISLLIPGVKLKKT